MLLEEGYHKRSLPLERISELIAAAPARRFPNPRQGAIETGLHADLALVDLNQRVTLTAGDLHQRHPPSPYLGYSFRGSVRRTIRRGVTIFDDGRITATSGGRLIRLS